MLVDGLSSKELMLLARRYSDLDVSGERRLLSVIAHMLDQRRLMRLARYFEPAELLAAVQVMAPHKADPSFVMAMQSIAPRFGAGTDNDVAFVDGIGRFLHMTPKEIYLDFRTAPVGALGVTGALWEAAAVLSKGVVGAGFTGYEIGTVLVSPLIQSYAPSLHVKIGDMIGPIVDFLFQSWGGSQSVQANAQRSSAGFFEMSSSQTSSCISFGGDFGIASSWCLQSGGSVGQPEYFYYDP
jgi:hypothetical protein